MSRVEKILQAMIDETSYDKAPQSRIEAILLAIKNNTQYSHLPHSRIEEILLAIKNNTSYDKDPMSRIEEILLAKLNSVEYKKPVQSKIEKLLLKWLYQDLYLTLKGVPPLTFITNGQPLVDWTIYGNTINGESVGDLITEGEHAGEYSVPVTVTNGTNTETTNIYLPEQIKKVGDEAEYIDYEEQKMHKVRKNLFPVVATSKTVNGVTFTVNADKSVTCNGTNNGTSGAIFEFNQSGVSLEIGELYIVTGCPEGGAIGRSYVIQYNNGSSWSYEIGAGATFTALGTGIARPRIIISTGVTVNNLTFYPMIRKANIEDDTYEPYIENTDLNVTLPALPTLSGTNTLSVGTQVQPSNMEIIYAPKEPELKLMMKKLR